MPALKYPVAYRNRNAREHSTPRVAVGAPANANQRPAPRTHWDRAFDMVGGRPHMVGPHSVAQDLAGQFRNEMRYAKQLADAGRTAAAARVAYRIARKSLARDIRAEIAISLLEQVFEAIRVGSEIASTTYVPTDANNGEWEWRSIGYGAAGSLGGLTEDEFGRLHVGAGLPPLGGVIMSPSVYPANAPRPWPVPGAIGLQVFTPATVFTQNLMFSECTHVIGPNRRYKTLNGYRRTVVMPAQAVQLAPRHTYRLQLSPLRWNLARGSVRPGRATSPNKDLHMALRPVAGASPTRPPVLPRVRDDKKYAVAFNQRAWYGALVNITTDALDIIDVAYSALGKKNGARTPQEKLEALYTNWSTFDPIKFLRGLVAMQVEDYFYGRIGKAAGEAARRVGRSQGFQNGPWDTEFSYHAQGMGFRDSNPIAFIGKFIKGT